MRSLLLNLSPDLALGYKRARFIRRMQPFTLFSALVALFATLCPEWGMQRTVEAAALANSEASGTTILAAVAGPEKPREMVYIHTGPESSDDHRYSYHWQVLRQALDKTSAKYGPYRIQPADFMSEERQVFELVRQSGKLNVILRGDTVEYEKKFECVWIPVDKGLLGYRVFLIRSEDQPRLTHEMTLDDLRTFSIGQGRGWKDIDILRANGLNVMAGGDYAGLFAMLANRRFDLFSRGVEEIVDEYALHKQQLPSVVIEQNLMLYYPIARYFWFSRSEQGHELAQRVREGMTMMIEDGSFDRLFESTHKELFNSLHLADRKLFVLQNPFATPQAPVDDSRYWYLPLKHMQPAPTTQSRSP